MATTFFPTFSGSEGRWSEARERREITEYAWANARRNTYNLRTMGFSEEAIEAARARYEERRAA